MSLAGIGNPAALDTASLLAALSQGASNSAGNGNSGSGPHAVAEIVDIPVSASITLEGFTGALSPSQTSALTTGLAKSLGVDKSRVTLMTPEAAAHVFARAAARSVSARMRGMAVAHPAAEAAVEAAPTVGTRRSLLAGLVVSFTITGFGADTGAASAMMTAITTSAVASDSPLISSLASAGVSVTITIAQAPVASVTVAITLQYGSPEAAAAGAAVVSDAISGGGLAAAISAVAPSLSLQAAALPETYVTPSATPSTVTPTPSATTATASPPPAAGTPAAAPPPADSSIEAAMLSSDDERRTVAIAVSLTVGAVVILAGAVVTVMVRKDRAARLESDSAHLLITKHAPFARDDEGYAPPVRRSSRRGINALSAGSSPTARPNSRDASALALGSEPTRAESIAGYAVSASDAGSDLVTRSGSKRMSRLSQLDPFASRHAQLLAVAVDGDEADAMEGPRSSTMWSLNAARMNVITPFTSRGALLGALLGTDLAPQDAPAAEQGAEAEEAPRRTPRNSAWRAPAQLGGDDESPRVGIAPPGRNPPARTNSMRTRRSSQTGPGGQH